MTPEHARLIAEAIDLDVMMADEEEVSCLEQNNPELLDAYRALIALGSQP